MHTLMVVGGGLLTLGIFLLAGRARGHTAGAALWFIPVWLVAALLNLVQGVSHGYSVMGEMPFFAVVFGLPAAIAAALWWKLQHR